ncbi:MAG: thiamine phosphate synthase [Proteobacteria bacterium]|nr:thiamine phosphate synthase [Pseudomonadota bacterium]MCP4916486.1 thiamine phosphate synthase [Pseudomonadota bacterium]
MIRGLYGIADAGFGDPVALAHALAAGGACVVQVRCKDWPTDRVADALRRIHIDVPLLVNDHVELAGLCDGVHLGQDDGPFPADVGLRGRSTHSLTQLASALAEGVDYVGFGPVFPTATKDAGPTQGLDELSRIVAASSVPVVAIGGIRSDNLVRVARRAQAWAVISAICTSDDVEAAARGFTSA